MKRSSGGNSLFGGLIFGILLIAIATPCTWYNEGKDVKIRDLLAKAKKDIKHDVDVKDPK